MQDPDQIASISDPGEIGRSDHNAGDRLIVTISNFLAWLFPILMLVIVVQVLLRNFGRIDIGPGNQAWMDDLQWWLYGIACLVGVGYAVTTNSHVRVDIFYDNYQPSKQRRIDMFALGWLFLPFIMLSWDVTFHYAYASVLAGEGSDSPNGLHNLWALKVLMNICFVLIGVAIVARLIRLLKIQGADTAWARFFWLAPSIAYGMNLVLFYAMWWLTRVTNPDMNLRSLSRDGYLMAEIEYGPYETKLTVIVALVLTAALGGFLYMRERR